MMSFRGGWLAGLRLPLGTVSLMMDIAEARGRQDLYTKPPQRLKTLRDAALVQSVESSSRLEGVTVAPDRLVPLVLENAEPRDRSEEQIRGYGRALDWIHTSAANLEITPDLLRRLHGLIQEGSGDPLLADPQAAIDELCLSYRHVIGQRVAPPLLAVPALVFDFLCIHPFREGNGRVSRLLSVLALDQHGFEVVRYVSLARLIEESRDDYDNVMRRSSEGWHEGKHDILPGLNYFLTIVKRAYREFAAGQA
jgi:Fic family protein